MTKTEFREHRERLDMTQMDLAVKLEVSLSTIARMEHGRMEIPASIGYAMRYLVEHGDKEVPDITERYVPPPVKIVPPDPDMPSEEERQRWTDALRARLTEEERVALRKHNWIPKRFEGEIPAWKWKLTPSMKVV